MVPNPTQIAAGVALVDGAFSLYPILGVSTAIVLVLGIGSLVMRKIRDLFVDDTWDEGKAIDYFYE